MGDFIVFRRSWRAVGSVLLVAGLLAAVVVSATPAEAATAAPGAWVSVAPTRILDTQAGLGAPKAAVAAHSNLTLQVAGRGSVPASGAGSVILEVAVLAPSAAGSVEVSPAGGTQAGLASLAFAKGVSAERPAMVKLGSSGRVVLRNDSTAPLNLVAEVVGYYRAGAAAASGAFTPLGSQRILDTRSTLGVSKAGAIAAGKSLDLQVTGKGGVPSSNVASVALVVVALAPGSNGGVAVWQQGKAAPPGSAIVYSKGQTTAGTVVVPVSASGRVTLKNTSSTSVHLLAAPAGYFVEGSPAQAGALRAIAQARLLDTRTGLGAAKAAVAKGGKVTVQIAGRGGVPRTNIGSTFLHIYVISPTGSGSLLVWDGSTSAPKSSVLVTPGATMGNLVVPALDSSGRVVIKNNSSAPVQLVAEVQAYTLKADLAVPAPAGTSRYVRNLSGGSSDATAMDTAGCNDATATGAAADYTVLEVGAQTNNPALGGANGVRLTGGSTRITDAQLVTAVKGYLDGFVRCRQSGVTLTLAVGTSSDGDWTAFTAEARGVDWANAVIKPLQSYSSGQTGTRVAAAIDIEAGFAATFAQANQWLTSFASAGGGQIVLDGSADACPSDFGQTGKSCGTVTDSGTSNTWTQADYLTLATPKVSGTVSGQPMTVVFPQIYIEAQAGQWANIVGTASSGHAPFLLGTVTERAICSTATVSSDCPTGASLTPAGAWAALWNRTYAYAQGALGATTTDLSIQS